MGLSARKEEQRMKQIKCPFDGTPCQSDCIDRFPHRQEGGCRLTDHLAAGMPVLVINKPTAELIGFYPDGTHEVFDLSDLPVRMKLSEI